MKFPPFLLVAGVCAAAVSGAMRESQTVRAQAPEPIALAGIVSSVAESAMEGVLVTAKRAGATIATTVVTNASGRYEFPRARLAAGSYTVRVRAVGTTCLTSRP